MRSVAPWPSRSGHSPGDCAPGRLPPVHAGAALARRLAPARGPGGCWDRGDLGGPAWTVLADGGHRFFADPFPVTWDGRTVLFFEEFDYRLGRGTIAGIAFGESGPVGDPFPVLCEPFQPVLPLRHGARGGALHGARGVADRNRAALPLHRLPGPVGARRLAAGGHRGLRLHDLRPRRACCG